MSGKGQKRKRGSSDLSGVSGKGQKRKRGSADRSGVTGKGQKRKRGSERGEWQGQGAVGSPCPS